MKIVKFKFVAVTFFMLSLLASCGGGGGGGDDGQATLASESLYGEPGKLTVAPAPPRETTVPPFFGYGVALYKVYQTDENAIALKAYLSDPTRSALEIGRLLLLIQTDYFSRKSLVAFDIHTMDIRHGIFRVIGLRELPEKIEVTVEVCSDRNGDTIEAHEGDTMGYFAIAKTNKPIVLLPLQFSPLPPHERLSIGACPAKK